MFVYFVINFGILKLAITLAPKIKLMIYCTQEEKKPEKYVSFLKKTRRTSWHRKKKNGRDKN